MKRTISCPSCQHAMDEIVIHGVTIDRCIECEGLWFDRFEIVKYMRGEIGERYGKPPEEDHFGRKIQPIDGSCPRCDRPSLQHGTLRGASYRVCSGCKGIYLACEDATQIVTASLTKTKVMNAVDVAVQGADLIDPISIVGEVADSDLITNAMEGGAEVASAAGEAVLAFVAEVLSGF